MTHGPLVFSRDGRFFRRGRKRCPILGVSYGPFREPLDGGDAVRRDLDEIAALGFNTIRLHELPGEPFLNACGERGLAVFISLQWPSNTDFSVSEPAILERMADQVRSFRGSPAVAGYFIANEISAPLVRWMGWRRVRVFLEEAFRRLRHEDASRLFAYANYPSTEYLQPRNGDFTAFNLYLEEREALGRYVRRLHHLADDRPLVISEYGLDSLRHGAETQAETLSWLTGDLFEAGVAGAFLFSYTDDWFNGGRQVTDWTFGLVTASREPKPSAGSVADTLRGLRDRPPPRLREPLPLVSVIVCTRNGHATLPDCLRSLSGMSYSTVEVIVVDDGSRPGIEKLVGEFPAMRCVRQAHAGLSAARNRGAREASGAILAFTDDDCRVDPEWVSWLVREFQTGEMDACGGPNIAPEAETPMERAIQMAPGNPTHVLLDDFEAEHLPGCNLAVTREAFEGVGGFSETYRTAGDDVDFCWRLQFQHRRLGFAPCAVVWHRRRRTWRRFLRQQAGYGRAEALLHGDHPQKYSPATGGTSWQGTVYAPLAARAACLRPAIYFGPHGTAPFQAIYSSTPPGSEPVLTSLVKSLLWLQIAAVMAMIGFGVPAMWGVSALMLAITAGAHAWTAWQTSLSGHAPWWLERGLIAWLSWSAGTIRQVTRWLHAAPGPGRWPRWETRWSMENSEGIGREAVLESLQLLHRNENPSGAAAASAWAAFDAVLTVTRLVQVTLLTVTEIHEGGVRRTHFSVTATLKPAVIGGMILFAAWLLGQAAAAHWTWTALGVAGGSALGVALHGFVQRKLRTWRSFVETLAGGLGLKRI